MSASEGGAQDPATCHLTGHLQETFVDYGSCAQNAITEDNSKRKTCCSKKAIAN